MPTDSPFRRAVKHILRPLISEKTYQRTQALAMAWDIKTGHWYEPEIDLIPFAVQAGETALDIGANFGLYSYHLSRAVGPNGRVYAFEPIPWTCGIFSMVAGLLRVKNVRLMQKGCSNQEGNRTFRVPVQGNGQISAGLAHIGNRDVTHIGAGEVSRLPYREFECEVVRLDQFIAAFEHLSFIKCDVEGAEAEVLEGAIKTIEEYHPTILCEVVGWALEAFGSTKGNLTKLLSDRGYGIYYYDRGDDGVGHLMQAERISDQNLNCLFIHAAHRTRFEPLLRE